jgi:hypothetical protein
VHHQIIVARFFPPYHGYILSPQWSSSTCGMDDLVLSPDADRRRRDLIAAGEAEGLRSVAACSGSTVPAPPASAAATPDALRKWAHAASVAARSSIRERIRGGAAGSDSTGAAAAQVIGELDAAAKRAMAASHSKVIESSLPHGLYKSFPKNQFRCAMRRT